MATTAPLTPPIPIGETLAGKYRIERVLGAGAMGIVLAATHVELDQKVAIKFLLPSAAEDSDTLARFGREGRTLAKLESEHVARVIDVGVLGDGMPYLVMEYLEGRDLAAVIRERGAIPPREAVTWLLHACDALADAHAVGVIHRDLKPANMFLVTRKTGRSVLKVLDFGISKSIGVGGGTGKDNKDDLSLTRSTTILGSPLYMAPEQLRESRAVDARTDVWALGVIAHELLEAKVPFNAETLPSLISKILNDPPAPTSANVPAQLSRIITRCLEKDPETRFQSVTDLADQLRAYEKTLGSAPPPAAYPPAPPPAPPKPISSFAASVDAPSGNVPAEDVGLAGTDRAVTLGKDEVVAAHQTPNALLPSLGPPRGTRRWPFAAVGLAAIGITALAVWGSAEEPKKVVTPAAQTTPPPQLDDEPPPVLTASSEPVQDAAVTAVATASVKRIVPKAALTASASPSASASAAPPPPKPSQEPPAIPSRGLL